MEPQEIRIVILEAGFVMVCRCPEPSGYPFWLPYTDMRIIRRWGTTKGLAELLDGPTATAPATATANQNNRQRERAATPARRISSD